MIVEMNQIVKDFGPVRAVDQVDFTVGEGQILGLLGENGAGKSTLMNILAGSYPQTSGSISLNGKPVNISDAHVANKMGIRFIHQELNLCNDLSVLENMFLAGEITRFGLTDKKQMLQKCEDVFRRMQVEIDPAEKVYRLDAAQKQLVEIAKALLFQSELIIMDEPSTALSTGEIENLFAIMRQLKGQGVSFIYISHKMPELFEICDVYYVLRDGKLVAKGEFKDVDEAAITEMMIGRQLANDGFDDKENTSQDEVALEVQRLSAKEFRDVSFQLKKGEILAVTGLQGSGREMLADVLFGAEKYTGSILIHGQPQKPRARVIHFMKRGVALVPRMRKERGIMNTLSIYDNLSMGYFNTRMRGLLISRKRESERYKRQKEALSIKAGNPRNPITSLSGGNQQKVILGRWLETDADILLFDNPTQGIDVGAKFEIYHLILELARQGKAVMVFSAEFPEIHKIADRCLVLYKGKINAELARADLNEKNTMYYSTGANLEVGEHA